MHTHTHIHTDLSVHVHVCVRVCMCMYVRLRVCVCVRAHVRVYMCIRASRSSDVNESCRTPHIRMSHVTHRIKISRMSHFKYQKLMTNTSKYEGVVPLICATKSSIDMRTCSIDMRTKSSRETRRQLSDIYTYTYLEMSDISTRDVPVVNGT